MEWKRKLAFSMALAMVFNSIQLTASAVTQTEESFDSDEKYELYPIPQQIDYQDGNSVFPEKVSVVFEKGIDQYTVDRAEEVLASGGMEMETIKAQEKNKARVANRSLTFEGKDKPDSVVSDFDKEADLEQEENNKIPATEIQDNAQTSIPATEIQDSTQTSIPATEIQDNAQTSIPATEIQDNAQITGLPNEVLNSDNAQMFVGIYGDDEDDTVDKWFETVMNTTESDYDVFEKTDSYILAIKDNKIGILGKDTDSAFYALTTLGQINNQIDNRTIRNLKISDWADVASRGFIEGYYGEPWSTEDRIELMRWGGKFKLNSYFYAPKDDPKHNAKWWELYSNDEIENKIKPLAKAGNQSKCQFVYALHPFMSSERKITLKNYDETFPQLKEKFEQVIASGVRQIAVLADDGPDQGPEVYIKVMKDVVDWVKSPEMQNKYPGLKTIVPYCPAGFEYSGNGAEYMKQFPPEVPIVMTGGKIWGEVNDNFTNTFYNTVGRGPYMWINWPCTDNSKRHLIMGGYTEFLHPNVDPEKLQGIVLNPMQQSEPSKVAIFGNACYSWNIWTEEQAEKAWEDSFKYVDHENHEKTAASEALRELSKHMINQNMDGRVVKLEESVELKPKLDDFKEKLANGVLEKSDIESMRKEFKKLSDAAETYRKEGNTLISNQMVYWLDTWQNITSAAEYFMDALNEYYVNDDASSVPQFYLEGQQQMELAETHGYKYVDHTEYAEVGVQHIMPFMRQVRDHVAQLAQLSVDPTKVIKTPVTTSSGVQNGSLNNMIDGDEKTEIVFQSNIKQGDSVGIIYSRPVKVSKVRFVLGRI